MCIDWCTLFLFVCCLEVDPIVESQDQIEEDPQDFYEQSKWIFSTCIFF